jgi:hypothetical protein
MVKAEDTINKIAANGKIIFFMTGLFSVPAKLEIIDNNGCYLRLNLFF